MLVFEKKFEETLTIESLFSFLDLVFLYLPRKRLLGGWTVVSSEALDVVFPFSRKRRLLVSNTPLIDCQMDG